MERLNSLAVIIKWLRSKLSWEINSSIQIDSSHNGEHYWEQGEAQQYQIPTDYMFFFFALKAAVHIVGKFLNDHQPRLIYSSRLWVCPAALQLHPSVEDGIRKAG